MENSGEKRMAFGDYYGLALKRPELTRSSRQRIAGALRTKDLPSQVANFFKAAATGSDIGNRIMVMVGDPEDTSAIMGKIVNGFAEYCSSDEGAFYAIEGCPYKEEPLHLIPPKLRKDLPMLGRIEGDLCSDCDRRFEGAHIEDVSVNRYPSADLSSSGDGAVVTFKYEGEGGPGAEQLMVQLVQANRGLFVGKGLFAVKAPKQLLYPFLGMTERSIKTPRYPRSSLDVVVTATASGEQYAGFSGLETQEALHDRVVSVWL